MSEQKESEPSEKPTDLRLILRSLGYLKPYWPIVAGGYLLLLVLNGFSLITPELIGWTVDRGMVEGNTRFLTWAVLGLLALTVLRGVITFFQGKWIEQASQTVAYDVRNELYAKLSSLSFSYHDRTEAGQLLARAMRDVERIRFLAGRATQRLVSAAVLLVATVIVLLVKNTQLALLTLAAIPLMIIHAYWYSTKLRPLWRVIREKVSDMTSWVEQNLRGARIVKGFAQEAAEIERFEDQNAEWFEMAREMQKIRAINNPLIVFVMNLITLFIIWYGGRMVVRGTITLGDLVAFNAFMLQLAGPVRQLGWRVPFMSEAAASAERVFEILDADSEVQESPDAIPLPEVEGHVRFDDVSFAYFGRHRVLDDINLEAKPGQVIALLGMTGSGKSTIINLIPRFYDVTKGQVTIDGYDVRDVTLESLRSQIGIVLQETTLFAATVRQNIAFGRPEATLDDIIEAAKAAQAHDFVMEMPEGYETLVGEQGSTLSGGQKQRVAIARALLKDPRILILDDALSSVDTETERLIQRALERLMQGRTSFVIAQRLSTVLIADQILVLDDGRIAARGTHAELLNRSGLYAEIYEQQLRPQEVEELIGKGEFTVPRRATTPGRD